MAKGGRNLILKTESFVPAELRRGVRFLGIPFDGPFLGFAGGDSLLPSIETPSFNVASRRSFACRKKRPGKTGVFFVLDHKTY